MLTNHPSYGTTVVFPPDKVEYDWRGLYLGNVSDEAKARGDDMAGATDAVLREIDQQLGASSHTLWIDDDFECRDGSPPTALLLHVSNGSGCVSDAALSNAAQRLGTSATLVVIRNRQGGWDSRWL